MLEPSEADEEEKQKEELDRRRLWEKIARRIQHPNKGKRVIEQAKVFYLLSQYDREHCEREPVPEDYLYCHHDED